MKSYKAYKYGAKVVEFPRVLEEVLQRKTALWNDLVRFHREYLEKEEALYEQYGGKEYLQAKEYLRERRAALGELYDKDRAARQRSRSRKTPPELEKQIKEAHAARKEAQAKVWDLQKEMRKVKEVKEIRGPLLEEHDLKCHLHARGKKTRAYPLLKDGDYGDIYARFKTASKFTVLRKRGRPRFHDTTDDCFQVQVQGKDRKGQPGRTWSSIVNQRVAKNTKVIIQPTGRGSRGGRRSTSTRDLVKFQITDGHWLVLNQTTHRPIPPEGRIKRIIIARKWNASGSARSRHEWSVIYIVEGVEDNLPHGDQTAVVVSTARHDEEGLRVAEVTYSDGTVETVSLPADFEHQQDHTNYLQHALDEMTNEVSRAVLKELEFQPPRDEKGQKILDNFRKTVRRANQRNMCRALQKLAKSELGKAEGVVKILKQWWRGTVPGRDRHRYKLELDGENRIGDDHYLRWAEALGYRDGTQHLHDLRSKLIRRRRDYYWRAAKRIADRIDYLVLENRLRPQAGPNREINAMLRLASPGEFVSLLRQQVAKRKIEVLDQQQQDENLTKKEQKERKERLRDYQHHCPIHQDFDFLQGKDKKPAGIVFNCIRCNDRWDIAVVTGINMFRIRPGIHERLVEYLKRGERSRFPIANIIKDLDASAPDASTRNQRWERTAKKVLATAPEDVEETGT